MTLGRRWNVRVRRRRHACEPYPDAGGRDLLMFLRGGEFWERRQASRVHYDHATACDGGVDWSMH